MNDTSLVIHHKETEEVRECGKSTGAKGYYFALVTLADDMRFYGDTLDDYNVYEGSLEGGGKKLTDLKPASDRVKNDLLKLIKHPH